MNKYQLKEKLECILCKYKNNPEECKKRVYSSNWHCPTLQNIYYGKLIDHYPFKMVHKIHVLIADNKANHYYDSFNKDFTENDNFKFIFGIKSYDDLSYNSDANLLTMNDLDVLYNKKNNTYSWSVEYIYSFETKDGKKEYLSRLLNCFHKFMKENGYNTQVDGFHTVFANCTEFDSLEECYANFKCCVNGYINS